MTCSGVSDAFAYARTRSGDLACCAHPVLGWRAQCLQANAVGRPRQLFSRGFSRNARRKQRRRLVIEAGLSGWEASLEVASNGVRVRHEDQQRSKKILAEVSVHASVQQVWEVLTDYERLAEFVPNLERCERLPSTVPGRILLRQRGCSQATLWRLEAEAVLEVREVRLPLGSREVRFRMLEGDFKEFSGRWVVEPDPTVMDGLRLATVLRYEISLVPRMSIPSTIVTHVVRAGLPANIIAIANRAEELAQQRTRAPGLLAAAWEDEATAEPAPVERGEAPWEQRLDALQMEALGVFTADSEMPPKGPAWPWLTTRPPIASSLGFKRSAGPSSYLGVTSVPLPPAASLPAMVERVQEDRQRQKEQLQASYPPFAVGWKGSGSQASAASPVGEVHLRRLDLRTMLHRRAVSFISIDASPEEVWAVLTDYERLPDFVPNLAVSQRLESPPGVSDRVVRLRQVGYKSMLYMVLHAEAVVDLVEKPWREIQFRQVEGNFQVLQGKWMLQEVEPEQLKSVAMPDREPRTVLKYAVEIQIPRTTRMLGLLEPFLERVVYEDIPLNLAAIKHRVEQLKAARKVAELEGKGEMGRAAWWRRALERPRLSDMTDDFEVLAAELQRCYGTLGHLPTRADLRAANRSDLEKALAAHGGPAEVAGRLGWKPKSRVRKPRGYWDSIPNVKREIDEFIVEYDLPLGVMPAKNDFIRANRYDIAKAVERWGGLYQLARAAGYQAGARRKANLWTEHISEVAANTGLGGTQGLFELAAETYKRNGRSSSDSSEEYPADDGGTGQAGAGEDGAGSAAEQEEERVIRSKAQPAVLPDVRDEIDGW